MKIHGGANSSSSARCLGARGGGAEWGKWLRAKSGRVPAPFIGPEQREAGGCVATSGGSVELQDVTVSVIDTTPRDGETVGAGLEEEADATGNSKVGDDAWCSNSN
jgi:hypothetical protein